MNEHEQEQAGAALGDEEAAQLLVALTPIEPPSAQPLRERVLSGLRQTRQSEFLTVAADGAGWIELGPAVAIKPLARDGTIHSFFVRLKPGGSLPAHLHDADEECIVLRGEGFVGDVFLRAGDYHRARNGSQHGAITTATEALLFIRGPCAILDRFAAG